MIELKSNYSVWLSNHLGEVWGKLTHCPSPIETSDSGQSIDNTRILNVDLIVPTTYAVQRDDIDTRRFREPRI